MAESFNRIRGKLSRAIAAYLVSTGTCGAVDDILSSNSRPTRKFPNTTVRVHLSKPEVHLTGIRRVTVHISIKGSASVDPSDPNPGDRRVQFDKRVSATYDEMMKSDDGQTLRWTAAAITAAGRALAVAVDATDEAAQFALNNADMTGFTCQEIYDMGEGDGEADGEGCSWEEILMFDVVASPSNVS